MVSVANPDYLTQSERIETFLVIAKRNGVSKDLRNWFCGEYLVDPKIPKRVPTFLKRGYDVVVDETKQSYTRLVTDNFLWSGDTQKGVLIDIIFVSLFSYILSIIIRYGLRYLIMYDSMAMEIIEKLQSGQNSVSIVYNIFSFRECLTHYNVMNYFEYGGKTLSTRHNCIDYYCNITFRLS